MTLKNFKQTIVNKFDKTVKAMTNRAIPIAKREAAKVMKRSSTEMVNQIFDVAYVAAIGIALTSAYLKPSEVAAVGNALDSVRTININIENLTINA